MDIRRNKNQPHSKMLTLTSPPRPFRRYPPRGLFGFGRNPTIYGLPPIPHTVHSYTPYEDVIFQGGGNDRIDGSDKHAFSRIFPITEGIVSPSGSNPIWSVVIPHKMARSPQNMIPSISWASKTIDHISVTSGLSGGIGANSSTGTSNTESSSRPT